VAILWVGKLVVIHVITWIMGVETRTAYSCLVGGKSPCARA